MVRFGPSAPLLPLILKTTLTFAKANYQIAGSERFTPRAFLVNFRPRGALFCQYFFPYIPITSL